MFREATNKGASPPNEPTYIDDYFIDHNTRDSKEENLFLAANQLIAKRYTDAGIFEHTYEQNLERLIRDFRSRSDYLTYVIFERTKDWDWINALGTISIFMDENNLPAFEQMPRESFDVIYKAMEIDKEVYGSEYGNFKIPGLAEIGRLAIEENQGPKVLDTLVGATINFADDALGFPYLPTHYILCCNQKHSRIYEQAYGLTPFKETQSTVYNGKDGLLMFYNFLELHQRLYGRRISKAEECKPDMREGAHPGNVPELLENNYSNTTKSAKIF